MNFDIATLFERLFGNIQPLCDESIDRKRYDNLSFYEEAVEFLARELVESAKWKNDNRYSANRIGERAYSILKRLVDDVEDELRLIEEEI